MARGPTGFPEYRKVPVPKWRHSAAAKSKTRHFTIDYQHIDPATAKAVLDHAETALADVTGALKDFDRANAGKTITIFVRENIDFPHASSKDCQINLPARFLVPHGARTGPVALHGRGPTLWHNIVNVCFPPNLKGVDAGTLKFWCEGLGGYMQAELAKPHVKWSPANYPTMGLPVDEAVASLMAQYGVLPLEDCCQRIGRTTHSPERRLAWLETTSFVQYLMGKNRRAFADFYCGRAPFRKCFGGSEADLWQEWLKSVEAYISDNFQLPPDPGRD
jgi:hypothetical protein